MQSDYSKVWPQKICISDDDSDSNPDWNEQLISAVHEKEGRSKKITEEDRLERIQDCLNEGADINAADRGGNTVLHIAVKRNWRKVTEFLLRNGARTDIYNRRGQMAIPPTATSDEHKIVNVLKEPSEDRGNPIVHRSTVANEFISVDRPQPSTSRGNVLQFCTDLSTRKIIDDSGTSFDRCPRSLKRKPSTDDDLNENYGRRQNILENVVNTAGSGRAGLSSKLRPCATEKKTINSSQFDGKKTYAASGLKRSLHGTVYQLKHLMLILHRAWKLGYPFRLSTEMTTAEKFDDLVLQYRDKSGKVVHRFMQVKHKQDESKKICASDLLAQGDADFSIQKYFISWRKILKNSEFSGSADSKCFILCTNIGLDLEGLRRAGIVCRLETEVDEFLKITNRSEQPPRYKLYVSKHSQLHDVLKSSSDVCVLARALAQRVHDAKDIDLKTDIFKCYHTALAQEIIDIGNNNFFRNFIKNNHLSGKAQNFREIFFSNTKQLSRPDTPDEDIWKRLAKCSLKLSTTFGKEFQLTMEPELTDVEKFAQEFVRLLSNAEEDNVVKIARKIYHKQARKGSIEKIVADNIDKLVGHVLIREGGKIKFTSQFLNDRIQSPGNIEKLKNIIKTRLGSRYEELDQIEFEINNFKTCDEDELYSKTELPDDDILDEEILEFLGEFVLAVNQQSECELGEMITSEIGADSQFNILNSDFVGASFQKLMLDWFKQRGKGIFLFNEDAEHFFSAMELKVSSLVTVGLNLAYPEKLQRYGVKYRDTNSELRTFVTNSNITEPRILNLIAPNKALLTAVRAYHTLLDLKEYEKNDSFIFIRLKTLVLTGVTNRVIRAFESLSSHHLLIVDCGSSATGNWNSQELWNPLFKIVEKSSAKKMIIITQENNIMTTLFGTEINFCRERAEKVSFNNLTEHSQRKLLEKQIINFQGYKERTSFGSLLGIHISGNIGIEDLENLEKVIDSSMLVRLMRDEEIRIGMNLKGLGEVQNYYINRTIVRRLIIKRDILRTLHTPDMFAVSNIREISDLADAVSSKDIDCETSPTESQLNKFTILENGQEANQFKILCEQSSNGNIHWLHAESGKLLWKQTLGDISELVKYKDTINSDDKNDMAGSQVITEDQLAAYNKYPKIVIISDTAGMGKTTVLNYLAGKVKESKSDLLVVHVDLTHHTAVLAKEQKNPSFKRDDANDAVDFLVEKLLNIKIDWEANVFKIMIKKHGNAALFFDGFDEISPNYESTVIDLLQTFAKLPIKKLFVSTRPHTREVLEIQLNTFSFTIQSLSTANQIEFLTKFWKLSLCNFPTEKRLRRYAEAVIKILARSIDDWMNELTGVPLQTRMVAEVFGYGEATDRGDFNRREEFLDSVDTDCEPKLPEKINLIDLYHRFIDKKYHIYCTEKRKDDPTNLGVEEDSEDLRDIFLKRHQTLALYTLFDEEHLKELLPSQQELKFDSLVTKFNKGRERTGIVTQVIDNKPYFIHRTFAEYFAAMFLIDILKNNDQHEPGRKFFVCDILLKPGYKTIRAFLNCLLSSEDADAIGHKSWKLVWDRYCSSLTQSALHIAAAEENCGIIQFFLSCFHEHPTERKALINLKDDTGRTAVYIAAEHSHWDAFRLLAQHGEADINFSINVGKPPLQMAASTGNLDVVKYLVDKGANVNSRDNFGFTPIDEGAAGGHLDVVEYLVTKGAEINCQSNSGYTPVHWASGKRNLDVLKYLVGKGANINLQDSFGMTPIYQSCLHGDLDIISYLLEAGADFNLPNMFGVTPLQYAASSGNWDAVRYLDAKGANSDCLDESSRAILHKAST